VSRGASLRGQGTPAYPARLRSERARNSLGTDRAAGPQKFLNFALRFCFRRTRNFMRRCVRKRGLLLPTKILAKKTYATTTFPTKIFAARTLLVLFAAQELVALDGGNNSHRALFPRLGALHAAEAAHADRSG
jgi:hypothetical protein